MEPNQPHIQHHQQDGIIQDHRALEGKKLLMKSQRSNSMWSSVADAMMMTGGPLFATGLIGLAKAFTDPTIVGGAVGFAAKASAAVIASEGAMMLIAVGAIIATAAVASKYVASRKWQSSDIDRNDYNAQMTARHMVKELEKHRLVMPSQPGQPAADQQWADAKVQEQQQTYDWAQDKVQSVTTTTTRPDGKTWGQYVTTRPAQGQDIVH